MPRNLVLELSPECLVFCWVTPELYSECVFNIAVPTEEPRE